jgi:uncharacterized protein YlaI
LPLKITKDYENVPAHNHLQRKPAFKLPAKFKQMTTTTHTCPECEERPATKEWEPGYFVCDECFEVLDQPEQYAQGEQDLGVYPCPHKNY